MDDKQKEAEQAARQRARNAKKATKRAAKRTERRELERQRQEEVEAARRAHEQYVADAASKYHTAKAADNPSSRSNQLRAKANALYGSLATVAPCLLNSRLSQVEGLYKDALSAAATPLERCSAAKNLAVTAKRTLTLTRPDGPAVLRLRADALRYYVVALLAGCECQSLAWVDDVLTAVIEVVDDTMNWKNCELVKERPWLADKWPDQTAVLEKLHSTLPIDTSADRSVHVASLVAFLSLTLAKHLFVEALNIQDGGQAEQEWRRALSLVGRVRPLFELAVQKARVCGNEAFEEDAASHLESVAICEAICRSVQARHKGDALMGGVLADSEELDMEGMRLVSDCYKEAIAHARGYDLEAEARAHGSLGRLYCNVLRMAERGLGHYRQVLDLDMAMRPKSVAHTAWYREAQAAVMRAQQEKAEAEERAKRQEKAPLLEELAAELEALQAAARKGAHVLVRHVYETHPLPGAQPVKLSQEDVCGDKIKETLRKAIIAYHPDRQVKHGRKWQVLADEITKELNAKYGNMK